MTSITDIQLTRRFSNMPHDHLVAQPGVQETNHPPPPLEVLIGCIYDNKIN